MLELRNVSHVYSQGTAFESAALKDISMIIPDNQFIGIIGHTGSGKSTLIQHLNGLLKATSGSVIYNGTPIDEKGFKLKELRAHVGLVFQYPEHQLFETTVIRDVMFGPKNMGMTEEEAEKLAKETLKLTGLDEKYFESSPFDLSGGQKRRAAIAGVLACKPDILVLDEPTAGLDPAGKTEILQLIREIKRTKHITVVLVSHSMEDVAEYVDRIIVMSAGTIVMDDVPVEIFKREEELQTIGLEVPQVTRVCRRLKASGLEIEGNSITIDEAYNDLIKCLK